MASLLTVEEAWQQIRARAQPLRAETVPLASAAGRVLAGDAHAAVDLPPFPSSAMDGFAVRTEDTPGRLPVVERIAAGGPATRGLAPGESMAIATGGVVPDGADAVVPIELVVEVDNSIEVEQRPEPGAHVRPRGGDLAAGDVVVQSGTLLPGSARAPAPGVRVQPSSRREPSCARRAKRSSLGRSSRRTASCSQRRSRRRARSCRRPPRRPTTPTRTE